MNAVVPSSHKVILWSPRPPTSRVLAWKFPPSVRLECSTARAMGRDTSDLSSSGPRLRRTPTKGKDHRRWTHTLDAQANSGNSDLMRPARDTRSAGAKSCETAREPKFTRWRRRGGSTVYRSDSLAGDVTDLKGLRRRPTFEPLNAQLKSVDSFLDSFGPTMKRNKSSWRSNLLRPTCTDRPLGHAPLKKKRPVNFEPGGFQEGRLRKSRVVHEKTSRLATNRKRWRVLPRIRTQEVLSSRQRPHWLSDQERARVLRALQADFGRAGK